MPIDEAVWRRAPATAAKGAQVSGNAVLIGSVSQRSRVWHPSSRPSAIRCGSCEIGPGAEQQYTLKDRKNYIHERVVDWQEGRSYRIEVFGGTVPMDEILAELAVEPEGAGSLLRMPIRYRPRWGLLGRLIEPVLLRPILPHMMRRVIGGLAAKAEVLALLRAA